MSVSGSTSSYIERYRAWAARNPGLVKDVQTFLKGLSYFLTGYLKVEQAGCSVLESRYVKVLKTKWCGTLRQVWQTQEYVGWGLFKI